MNNYIVTLRERERERGIDPFTGPNKHMFRACDREYNGFRGFADFTCFVWFCANKPVGASVSARVWGVVSLSVSGYWVLVKGLYIS